MKIFLAGGTGVLGRAAVPRLRAAGHDIVAVARTPAKADQVRSQGAEPVTLDLFDPAAVRAAVDGCQAVVHMA
ncbi:MAG: NAD(P)H-binding protein, partial [Acidimicrobiales bacterium]